MASEFDPMSASDSVDAEELDLTPQKLDDIKRGSKLVPAAV